MPSLLPQLSGWFRLIVVLCEVLVEAAGLLTDTIGSSGSKTWMLNFSVPGEVPPVASTVKIRVPHSVGVPLMTPAPLSDRPGGRTPAARAYVDPEPPKSSWIGVIATPWVWFARGVGVLDLRGPGDPVVVDGVVDRRQPG